MVVDLVDAKESPDLKRELRVQRLNSFDNRGTFSNAIIDNLDRASYISRNSDLAVRHFMHTINIYSKTYCLARR